MTLWPSGYGILTGVGTVIQASPVLSALTKVYSNVFVFASGPMKMWLFHARNLRDIHPNNRLSYSLMVMVL